MDYNQTRSFNLGIARELSIEAALVFDELSFNSQTFAGGDGWFYRPYAKLMERLPIKEAALRRAVKELKDAGYVAAKVAKVDGVPMNHFRILRNLRMETAKIEVSETAKVEVSYNDKQLEETTKKGAYDFLQELIAIINPKEKPTFDRERKLIGRLKDYTRDEVRAAARAFSQSQWHIDNKQMSIDNLLAPSKFGRWYQQGQATYEQDRREKELQEQFSPEAREKRKAESKARMAEMVRKAEQDGPL